MGFVSRLWSVAAAALFVMVSMAQAAPPFGGPGPAELWVNGLAGGSGSTIGPGGAIYVTEGAAGRISRIDPRTGEVTTFASGLPQTLPWVGIGGAIDVAFIGSTAYALVTLVGPDVGGSDTVGIYRVDGPNTFTVIADIGQFALANPPDTDFEVPTGLQYAIEAYRGGLLVTDGHHNRVLWVTQGGQVSVLKTFGNTVPTGLDTDGNTIYMAQAGAVPHNAADGKLVSFGFGSQGVTEMASGARLAVDVERGRGRLLYVLSQGIWDGVAPGTPASPNTGALLVLNADGDFDVVKDGLDRPTSVEFIGTTAYVVTLTGDVWRIRNVSPPPYGIYP